MTGSASTLQASNAASGLPIPHITLSKIELDSVLNPNGVDYTFAVDGTKINPRHLPMFTAIEIPKALFKEDLRLELVMYKRTTRKNARNINERLNGYHHPTHNPASNPSPTGGSPYATKLPNSRFRGGGRALEVDTITEWTVTSNGQKFYIDTLGNFITGLNMDYISAANNGGTGNVQVYVSTNKSQNGRLAHLAAKTFGYSAVFKPLYFAFRFSIKDKKDPRGQRIVGGTSKIITFAPNVHPFVQNAAVSAAVGSICLDINPAYKSTEWNCWFETRLPT
jgi:hypothetical protein